MWHCMFALRLCVLHALSVRGVGRYPCRGCLFVNGAMVAVVLLWSLRLSSVCDCRLVEGRVSHGRLWWVVVLSVHVIVGLLCRRCCVWRGATG